MSSTLKTCLERCAYCGFLMEEPCDLPPADICERAVSALHGQAGVNPMGQVLAQSGSTSLNGFETSFSRPCGIWVRQCLRADMGYRLLSVGNSLSFLERRA